MNDFNEVNEKKYIGDWLQSIYLLIGNNRPDNHEMIVDVIYNDLYDMYEEDENVYNTGEYAKAFRRMLENKITD